MESVGGPLYFCITVKASIIYHTLATQPIKKFEAPEISLLDHIASLMLKNEGFWFFSEKSRFSEHVATWILLLFSSNFFGCKTNLLKASIIYHILATQPIKKFEVPEISLLAHIASLKKICLKIKNFEFFQKRVDFPSM